MTEQWKEVSFDSRYQVSSLGRVRSARKVLIVIYDKFGYGSLRIGKHKKLIHRLVAIEFVVNEHNKPQVNHIDGDKSNNASSNLEWCTAKENTNHGINTGLRLRMPEVNNRNLDAAQIKIIRECIANKFKGRDIARYFKCLPSQVSQIKRGHRYQSFL